MANVIRHKRGTSDPVAGDFSQTAELLVRTDNGAVFSKTDGSAVARLACTSVAQSFTAQQTYKELKETAYSLTGTSIDPANGSIQYKTVAANTTFTEALEEGQMVVFLLNAGASYTITWPTTTWVTSSGNSAPTLTANDTIVFWKVSTTLYGAYVGSYA